MHNNTWILPEVKKDIDALRQEELAKKQSIENEAFLKEGLIPNYVLIDAALWDTDIDILFLDPTLQYRSLFRGSTGEKLWSVAPYLVDISSDETLVTKIKEKDAVERRVTWLSSPLQIDELRKHLRRFLRMKTGSGEYVYFRFYDPYVVNDVFPHLSINQYMEFFDKIDYLIANDRQAGKNLFYLSVDKKLLIENLS
ncbi:DUF4123 domain-containing protein [Bacteroides sp. 224]|uniref:DUF4123 domain-containing protein n=1 Tax=Bacteroides sp. 224 TaxID=2302936 RepID=UPI0013D4FC07|nr:DUF4123 domain-containing protein [Bacteroides sp. 224]NDV65072.1 DUF4123 domain-containing protein [Bacteroides sp. 224]